MLGEVIPWITTATSHNVGNVVKSNSGCLGLEGAGLQSSQEQFRSMHLKHLLENCNPSRTSTFHPMIATT